MPVSEETIKHYKGRIMIMCIPPRTLEYILRGEKDPELETKDIKNYRQHIFQYLQICDLSDLEVLINKLTERYCFQSLYPNLLEQFFKDKLIQHWTTVKKEVAQLPKPV